MVFNYTAPIMSAQKTLNNTRYSMPALWRVIRDQRPLPVFDNQQYNKPQIGSSISLEMRRGFVVCNFFTTERLDVLDTLDMYLLPRGILVSNSLVLDEQGISCIGAIDLTDLSTSYFPADPTLTKIRKR